MHDSHIHLSMEPLASKIDSIIDKFLNNGGKYILTQGTDIKDFEKSLEISRSYQGVVQLALGLHPTFVEEVLFVKGDSFSNFEKRTEEEFNKYQKILVDNIENVSAIGEVGLDYHHINLNKLYTKEEKDIIIEKQKFFFRKQIELAKKYKLPLSIHARDSHGSDKCIKDTLEIVAKEGRGSLTGSFHSYTGDIQHTQDILDLGFNIGFNGIITYNSGENVRAILKKVPPEKILFETDGPFLPPQSVRKNKKIEDKFSQPADVREIIDKASEVKKVSVKELEEITDSNYEETFLKEIRT